MHMCPSSWLWAFLWCNNGAHKRLVVLGERGSETTHWVTQSKGSLDTQNGNHWHVSVNIISGSFTLVHRHRIPRQSPVWRCLRGNAHESNVYNPVSSASILWRTHRLYSQQLAASGLPTVSISWPLSFTIAQGLWLPRVPITIFLQNFLFTLWAPLPSRVSIG